MEPRTVTLAGLPSDVYLQMNAQSLIAGGRGIAGQLAIDEFGARCAGWQREVEASELAGVVIRIASHLEVKVHLNIGRNRRGVSVVCGGDPRSDRFDGLFVQTEACAFGDVNIVSFAIFADDDVQQDRGLHAGAGGFGGILGIVADEDGGLRIAGGLGLQNCGESQQAADKSNAHVLFIRA